MNSVFHHNDEVECVTNIAHNKTWPGWLGIFCTLRKLVIGPQLCRVFNMSHVATIIIPPGKFSMSQLCSYDQSKMKGLKMAKIITLDSPLLAAPLWRQIE